jgi:hypothetical protein
MQAPLGDLDVIVLLLQMGSSPYSQILNLM